MGRGYFFLVRLVTGGLCRSRVRRLGLIRGGFTLCCRSCFGEWWDDDLFTVVFFATISDLFISWLFLFTSQLCAATIVICSKYTKELSTAANIQSNCILQQIYKAIVYCIINTKRLYSAVNIQSNCMLQQIYKAIVYCIKYTKQLNSAAHTSTAALQTFPGVERRPHDKRRGLSGTPHLHTNSNYQLKVWKVFNTTIEQSRNELTKLGGQIQMSRRDKSGWVVKTNPAEMSLRDKTNGKSWRECLVPFIASLPSPPLSLMSDTRTDQSSKKWL